MENYRDIYLRNLAVSDVFIRHIRRGVKFEKAK